MYAIAPIVLLLIFLLLSLMITETLAYIPLGMIYHLHLPRWIGLGILVVLFTWLIGD
ncbi:MAG: hypothetical protein ACTS2F_08510 [Thainema sp.]